MKLCCWRGCSSDAVTDVDVLESDLWIGRVKDEAVYVRLVVDVDWSWRNRLRTLWSKDADRDMRMVALPIHLYSGLSTETLTIVGLCK